MSSIPDHVKHCEEILGEGNGFKQVHQWLDSLFNTVFKFIDHRDERHNMWGVEEIRKEYGDLAAKAAMIHIMDDWELENEYQIPKNKSEAKILRLMKLGQAPGLKMEDIKGAGED